jgi:Tol biopolymer transport system component
MKLQRRSLLVCFMFVLTLTMIVPGVSYGTGETPTGANVLYMPLIQRAEPALSDYVGIFHSAAPGYPPQPTPLPISEIYTMRADGSERTRLTDNEVNDDMPMGSADGSMILWRQSVPLSPPEDGYEPDLWLMNRDGTNQQNLTNSPGIEQSAWAPTGATLAFTRNNANEPNPDQIENLYIISAEAMTPTLVVSNTGIGPLVWSPDGSQLAFSRLAPDGSGGLNLYTVKADGSGVTMVAEGLYQTFEWSPDNLWLAYEKEDGTNLDIYVSRADGTETRQLTMTPEREEVEGWVEGGARLLIRPYTEETEQWRSLDLVTVADGTITPFVPNDGINAVFPVGISPDGQTVAIVLSDQVDRQALYIQATDSLTPTQISPDHCASLCDIQFAGWSSDERYVAYNLTQIFTPGQGSSRAYVAVVDISDPYYWLLEDDNLSVNQWLPYGSWLSVYYRNTLRQFNVRTMATVELPLAEDGYPLYLEKWRYLPPSGEN